MTGPALVLPSALRLTLAVLRAAIPGLVAVHDLPNDFAKLPSFIRVFKTPGSSAIDPDHLDRVTMNIVAFAKDSPGHADGYDAAETLAGQCGRALWLAYKSQTVYTAGALRGSISSYTEQSSPWPDDAIDLHNFYAFQATYTLTIRPQ